MEQLKIDGKELNCVANAITPMLFRMIFKKDFLVELSFFIQYKDKEITSEEDMTAMLAKSDSISKMLFVMNKQASESDTQKLMNTDLADYYNWLASFSMLTFMKIENLVSIVNVWKKNAGDFGVDEKNQEGQEIDR